MSLRQGLLQGSVIYPLLLLIYFDDLQFASPKDGEMADGVFLFISHSDKEIAEAAIEATQNFQLLRNQMG